MNASAGLQSRQALGDASSHVNVSNNEHQFVAPTAADLFDEWLNCLEARQLVSSPEAKKEYFLTARDLSYLFYEPIGGEEFATGPPTKWYCHIDLLRESLRKHGEAGVKRKLVARYKREEKQRMKEERAQEALQRLQAVANTDAGGAAGGDNAATTEMGNATQTQANNGAAASDGATSLPSYITDLRRDLLGRAKRKMHYKFFSDAPRKWKFEMTSITKPTFAAIMGRPNDVELESFVKNGAYYTVTVDAWDFFVVTDEFDLQVDFDCCSQKIAPDVTVRYKPTTMELSVSGVGEMYLVCWPARNQEERLRSWRRIPTSWDS